MKLYLETTHFPCSSIQITEYLGNSATYCYKVKVTLFIIPVVFVDNTILIFLLLCYPVFFFILK